MDLQLIGRILLIIGAGIAVLGGLMMLLGRFTGLGNLPGNFRIEGQGFTCLFPFGTMLLLSIVLTIILNIIVRLINRP